MVRYQMLAAALLFGAFFAPSSAEAQQPAAGAQPGARPGARASATASGKPKDDGYAYEFTDDPLAAGGLSPNDATIRVRPGPVRSTLIKPRVSFVPEMLKSVENL